LTGGDVMIRIVLAEDDAQQRQLLKEHLARFSREAGVELDVAEFEDGAALLFHYQPIYDIILLDIEMPRTNGMEAAKKIRAQDSHVVLIFVTSMAQYAIQGYKVRAQSYILKPVNYYSLYPELLEAVNTVKKRRSEKALLLPTQDGLIKVPIADICYIESRRHTLLIHTTEETYAIRETMKRVTEQLEGEPFAHSSVSFLVNLTQVTGIYKTEAVVGGDRVPISRQKYKAFLEELTNHMGSGRRG